ncbi:MAG: hypothetical protein ACPGVN_02150 [Alphaproteobacteria bacterium]
MSSAKVTKPTKVDGFVELYGPVKLQKSFGLNKMNSNNPAHNSWLAKTAVYWQLAVGREVFVLIDSLAQVKAFYCLSVARFSLSENAVRQHRVIMLTRMAISEDANVPQTAELLLRGVLIKAAKASQTGDFSALVIHATDERLVELYGKFGFVGFQKTDHATLLVKSMKAIRSEAWLAGHID